MYNPRHELKMGGRSEGWGTWGGKGIKGKNWEHCNSMIKKIYFTKIKNKVTNLNMLRKEVFPHYSIVPQELYSGLVFCKHVTSILSVFTLYYNIGSHGPSDPPHN